MIERTFVALKPDAVQRGISGEIIHRFERSGLRIAGMKMIKADKELLEKHYGEHKGKPFYENLVDFMREGPVIAMVIEGVDAVDNIRKIVGDTEPYEAVPGTIRGDFAHVSAEHADEVDKAVKNIVHASGDREEAKEEIDLWFGEQEIHDYKRSDEFHIV